MKHHLYNPNFKFLNEPIEFNKYTEKDVLQYCLGATLYMPGTKDIAPTIINKKIPGLTSMVMCFEDAISEEDLPNAEQNVRRTFDTLKAAIKEKTLLEKDLPLIFFRVRTVEQFEKFSKTLNKEDLQLVTGFVFPKFGSDNGYYFLQLLRNLNDEFNEIIYGMPILESNKVIYKESRDDELKAIRTLIEPYKDLILNIRVGATDFSSSFGIRRGINYSIYDILVVRDCLSDVLNMFSRQNDDYTVSAPVWEYFLTDKTNKFKEDDSINVYSSILKRETIVNVAIDGLLREIILDKANGFVGKTIIHPSHLRYVNAMQAVTKEEYEDAMQILDTSGGVIKSTKSNKMNEINPHKYWAIKTKIKSQVYGVIEGEDSYEKLFQ